jgi:ribonuclease R
MDRVRGRISVHARGFGFLTLDDGRSAFVAPPDLNPFLADDLASAEVVEDSSGRLSARSLSLEARDRDELLGGLVIRRGRAFLEVDSTVANTQWPIDSEGFELPAAGAHLVCRIQGDVAVPERVVPESEVSLERVLVRHGIRAIFPEDCRGDFPSLSASTFAGRRDLTGLATITIDAPVSKDLDDALSVLPADPDGGLRLLVSIADVDSLVSEGSPLDLEARRRGTSTYLAGAVIPMLPRELSEHELSLLQGAERPALTAELRIDPEGAVTAVDLYESRIRSTRRLDYDTVAAFLDDGETADLSPELVAVLRWLRTASARIGATRAARGGVHFLREEAYVTIDRETQEPTAIDARSSTSAHTLVERLMVAANEAVGRWLVERGLPGMFRVHDQPDRDRAVMLAEFAHNFGFELGLADRLTPRGLAALELQFEGTAVAPAMREVLSRALGPARYSSQAGLHFGLAAPTYLHFTSPIRRYADLTVHRVVKRFLAGRRDQRASDPAFEQLALHLNDRNRRSSKAETERLRMMAARWFSSRTGERYAGNVVAIKPFGLVIQLRGAGVSGSIPSETLPNRKFMIGESVEVTVAGTDETLGRIDLRLC